MPPAGIFEDQRGKGFFTKSAQVCVAVQAGTPMAVTEEDALSLLKGQSISRRKLF